MDDVLNVKLKVLEKRPDVMAAISDYGFKPTGIKDLYVLPYPVEDLVGVMFYKRRFSGMPVNVSVTRNYGDCL